MQIVAQWFKWINTSLLLLDLSEQTDFLKVIWFYNSILEQRKILGAHIYYPSLQVNCHCAVGIENQPEAHSHSCRSEKSKSIFHIYWNSCHSNLALSQVEVVLPRLLFFTLLCMGTVWVSSQLMCPPALPCQLLWEEDDGIALPLSSK